MYAHLPWRVIVVGICESFPILLEHTERDPEKLGLLWGALGYVWTEAHIDEFIADPKGLLPTSTMSLIFPGIESAEERANIIAYLKTFSQ